MGGFLYIRKTPGDTVSTIESKYRRSIIALQKKGLPLRSTIDREQFVLFVFDKLNFQSQNLICCENGDFVVAVGTLIYRRQMGATALRLLYDDFQDGADFFSYLNGHFAVLLLKAGNLYVFNDFNGLYHIYSDSWGNLVSSSFLAVLKSLERKTVARQELYEYISYGATYGDRTLVEEVKLLDSFRIHRLLPRRGSTWKVISVPRLHGDLPFEEMVDSLSANLVGYFDMLRENFGDGVSSGLSGGYDSRLMLALLQKSGVRPHLYVYGRGEDADVRVATMIAARENLRLTHRDKARDGSPSVERFREIVEAEFHFHDGRGASGVLDNGADLATRQERVQRARLHLNGGGGEIYRNYWRLPDRPIHVETFLRAKCVRPVFSWYTDLFDRREYLGILKEKIKFMLQAESDLLTREQVEQIYPAVRLKYWMAPNNKSNNLLSYALTPFAEPIFTIPSTGIPLRYKDCGRLEAAIIRKLSPSLAAYPSSYGFNFYDEVPRSARLWNFVRVHTPVFIIPVARALVANHGNGGERPCYLTEKYLASIFDLRNLEVSRYVDLGKVEDPEVLNRAYTAELILQERF